MSSSSPRFSVLVVNFNGGTGVRETVRSVLEDASSNWAAVTVLDNASTDASVESLRRIEDERLRLLPQTENHGFAGGNNIAAGQARGEWLVLLNPDAAAHQGWLEAIARGIEEHGEDKLFASVQHDSASPHLLDGLGDAYLGLGIPWRGAHGLSADLVPGDAREVFGPCGAAFAIRRDLFEELGGFPERFFCYCEDVDLAFRARLAGHRTVLLPDARVDHEGSGIVGKASPFSLYHGTRNRLWVFVRCMPGWSFPLLFPLHLLATLAICLYGVRKGRAGPSLRGLRDGLRALPAVLKERRQVQKLRTVPVLEVLSAMSWNPLRLLRRQPDLRPLRKRGGREGHGRQDPPPRP